MSKEREKTMRNHKPYYPFDLNKNEFEIIEAANTWSYNEEAMKFKPNLRTKKNAKKHIYQSAVVFGFLRQVVEPENSLEELRLLVIADLMYYIKSAHKKKFVKVLELGDVGDINIDLPLEEFGGSAWHSVISEMIEPIDFGEFLYLQAVQILNHWSEETEYITSDVIGKELDPEQMDRFAEMYPVAVSLTQKYSLKYAMDNGFDLLLAASHNPHLDNETKEVFIRTHKLKTMFA